MKTRGFTLIELLAVLIVLGLISSIAVVSVSKTLNDSRGKIKDIQIKEIKNSAKQYYINLNEKELSKGSSLCVNVSKLIEEGYFEKDSITDPTNDDKMYGSVVIKRIDEEKYKYEYSEEECK